MSGNIVCFSMYDVLAYINKISENSRYPRRGRDTPICLTARVTQEQREKILYGKKKKMRKIKFFPSVSQELEIEAFTCTVLRCVKKKNLPLLRPLEDSVTARDSLIAQLTLVQASASLTIEMAYCHSARYICITVTVYAGCVRNKADRDRMRKIGL